MTSGAAGAEGMGLNPGALEALGELLGLLGIEVSRHALVEECGVDFSLSSMAKCLQRRGLRARLVALVKGDLSHLGLAIVQLSDRSTALYDGQRGCLALPAGQIVTSRREIEGMLGGAEALDVSVAWAKEGLFLKRLWRAILEDARIRNALLLFAFTLTLSAAFGFVQPIMTETIVDTAIPEGATGTLRVLIAGLILATALSAIISNVSERASLHVEVRLAAVAHAGILEHYLALPLLDLQRQSVGGVLQTQRCVPPVIYNVIHGTIQACVDLLLGVGYTFWIAQFAPGVAMVLLGTHLVLAVVVMLLGQRAARQQNELIVMSTEQSNRLLALIERIVALRVAVASSWGIGRWSRALAATQSQELKLELTNSVAAELVGFVQRICLAATMLWAAFASSNGRLSIGQFVALVTASMAASSALTRLISHGPRLLTTRQQLGLIDRVVSQKTTDRPVGMILAPQPEQGIVCDGVWFRYRDDAPWTIRNFSVTFRSGAVHTVGWPSGRGKSTLLRLIAGLNAPNRGSISVFGLDARAARTLVCYVPQACPLFAGSVLHNLRLFCGGATLERLQEAARLTGLAEVLSAWPMGIETIVASGGANLSSGQRQLVVLTAALASTCPVLLLDEATTHLDLITRASLEQSLLLRGRTVVNVVHFDTGTPTALGE
jgi:ATP-binding cassette subfamily B protein